MEKILQEFCEFSNFNDHTIKKFLKHKGYMCNTSSNEEIVIFTDGACNNNGKNYAKGGVGVFFQGSGERISQSFVEVSKELLGDIDIGKPTNQKAELLAILKALKTNEEINKGDVLKPSPPVIIKTDSMYCVNIFTKWYLSWERKGWKLSTGKEVMNKEIIQEVLKYMKDRRNIFFEYVPAHKEEPLDPKKHADWYGNRIADDLAVAASC